MLEPSFLSEREQTIGRLERGMYVTKFFAKKRPEKKLLAVSATKVYFPICAVRLF